MRFSDSKYPGNQIQSFDRLYRVRSESQPPQEIPTEQPQETVANKEVLLFSSEQNSFISSQIFLISSVHQVLNFILHVRLIQLHLIHHFMLIGMILISILNLKHRMVHQQQKNVVHQNHLVILVQHSMINRYFLLKYIKVKNH